MLDQLALADLIARGDFDRHLRHHRRLYQPPPRGAAASARRAACPATRSPAPRPACTPSCTSIERRARGAPPRASANGVALDAIDGALVVGYANLPESLAPAAVEALAEALR